MAIESAPAIGMQLKSAYIRNGVGLVTVDGELDLYSSPDLLRALRELADANDTADVIVDLTPTSFIDSTGLGILVAATKMMRLRGRELHVVGTNPATERAVRSAGLHTFLALAPTIGDALAKT